MQPDYPEHEGNYPGEAKPGENSVTFFALLAAVRELYVMYDAFRLDESQTLPPAFFKAVVRVMDAYKRFMRLENTE